MSLDFNEFKVVENSLVVKFWGERFARTEADCSDFADLSCEQITVRVLVELPAIIPTSIRTDY